MLKNAMLKKHAIPCLKIRCFLLATWYLLTCEKEAFWLTRYVVTKKHSCEQCKLLYTSGDVDWVIELIFVLIWICLSLQVVLFWPALQFRL